MLVMTDTIYCKINAFKKEIKDKLKSTDHIVFQGKADLTEVRVKDNKDETKTYTYIAIPTLTDVKVAENELSEPKNISVTYHTKKTSRSQALRQKAYVIAIELGDDPDKLYDQAIDSANMYLDALKDEKMVQ